MWWYGKSESCPTCREKPEKASQSLGTFDLCFDLWWLKRFLSQRETDFHGRSLLAANFVDSFKGWSDHPLSPPFYFELTAERSAISRVVEPKSKNPQSVLPILGQKTGNLYFLSELWIDPSWGQSLTLEVQDPSRTFDCCLDLEAKGRLAPWRGMFSSLMRMAYGQCMFLCTIGAISSVPLFSLFPSL